MERRFILTTAFIVDVFVKVFSQTCPPPTLWTRFAKKECSEESFYHCLKDEINKDYTSKCIQPIRYPAGNRVVYHNNLNAVLCDNDRYQPDPYWSNELNNCIYEKSTCNEEGQLIYSNGTSTSDRSCLCDYTRGYAFITTPKHINFCIPSIEDCQCYVKICPKYNQVLRSDYSCSDYIDNTRPSTTPNNVQPTKIQEMVNYDDKIYVTKAQKRTDMKVVLMILICCTIVMFLLGIICIPVCMRLLKQIKGDETLLDPKLVKRKTKLEINQAKENRLFVKTEGYKFAAAMLKKEGFVLLKGRYGSGKTISALHLASYYANRGYETYRFEHVDISEFKRLMMTTANRVVILENIIGDLLLANTGLKEWEQILQTLYPFKNHTKIIVTTYQLNQQLQEHLVKNGFILADVFVDLDSESSLSLDDKKAILNVHSSRYAVSCGEDRDHIVITNPVFGFPLMCSLFCTDKSNRSLGKDFFTQAPTALVQKIEALKTNGVSNRFEGIKYSILVYIALSNDNSVDVSKNQINTEKFNKIFKTVYNDKFRDGFKFAENAADEFIHKYLKKDDAKQFSFINNGIEKAILITYGRVDPMSVIKEASFENLLSVIRSNKYKQNPAESSFKLTHQGNNNVYKALATRIIHECVNGKYAELAGKCIKDYFVSSDDYILLGKVLNLLKLKMESVKNANVVQSVLTLFQLLTNESKQCLPLTLQPRDFRLTWEMVCAARNCKASTFKQLVKNAEVSKISPDFITTAVDQHGNSLLHYLVIWGHDAGLVLLGKLDAKDSLPKNRLNLTPLHFAAFFARPTYLKILLRQIDNKDKTTVLKILQKILKNKINSPNENIDQFESYKHLLNSGENKTIHDISVEPNFIKMSDLQFGSEKDVEDSLGLLQDAFKIVLKDDILAASDIAIATT